MARTLERCDIVHLDLEPTKGREQRGQRYAFVLSPAAYNWRGVVIVLLISRGVTLGRSEGFAATFAGAGLRTDGVVICDQPRAVNAGARGVRYVETAPDVVVEDVLHRLAPLAT